MATFRKYLPALTGIALASLITFPAGAVPISQLQSMQTPNQEMVHQVRSRGGAIAAGVIGGLALGAIIGGAANAYGPPPPVGYGPVYAPPAYAPPPPPGDWYAYCASKYRSFDPATGTYLGYDGFRHPCQ